MNTPGGTIERRANAYRQAVRYFEKQAEISTLRSEQFSLIEKLDVLMEEWKDVPSKNRSDEYHESRLSIDNQLALLEANIKILKVESNELQLISELNGLSPTFLHDRISNLRKKKLR